ncbi:hypothetical protein FGB62_246g07 [Gracilaria domingensis]|nr:hypothetical protein FGB62_246g07 [Gracilaria domingensis]
MSTEILISVGQGPQEMERMRTALEFEKNVKQGEYIDDALYGRRHSRVFSEMRRSGGESCKSQMQLVKGTETHRNGNTWFLPPSSLDPADGKRSTDGDKLLAIERPRRLVEEHPVEQVKAVDAHAEEDTRSFLDDTPSWLKRKVDSGKELCLVEKRTVVRTLTKLRSTGSSVFKDTRSLVCQDDNRNYEDFNAVKFSSLVSNDSGHVVQVPGTQPSREDVRSRDASLILRELFY